MCMQARLIMHAFPEAPFRLNNWTASGYHCILDRKPDRNLDLQVMNGGRIFSAPVFSSLS